MVTHTSVTHTFFLQATKVLPTMSVDCFMALQDPLLYCRTFVISVTTTAAGYPSCIAILYGTIYANLRYSFLLVEICYAGYSGTSVPREPWCFPYTAYGSTAPPAPLPYLVLSTYGTWCFWCTAYGSTTPPTWYL